MHVAIYVRVLTLSEPAKAAAGASLTALEHLSTVQFTELADLQAAVASQRRLRTPAGACSLCLGAAAGLYCCVKLLTTARALAVGRGGPASDPIATWLSTALTWLSGSDPGMAKVTAEALTPWLSAVSAGKRKTQDSQNSFWCSSLEECKLC
jgi:hypothetical protein